MHTFDFLIKTNLGCALQINSGSKQTRWLEGPSMPNLTKSDLLVCFDYEALTNLKKMRILNTKWGTNPHKPGSDKQTLTAQQHLHEEETSQDHFYEQTSDPSEPSCFHHSNKQENNDVFLDPPAIT